MRNAVLALVAWAVAAAAAPAQSSWADKMFEKGATHDFGNVARGAQLFHRFEITNIYAVPLDIQTTRTSCGCVTVTPSVRTLKPKEKATIDVFMDARRFTGPKTVSVYLTVGPDYVSTATLQVSANSRADVVFNPGQVNLGVVPRGQTPSQSVDVEYAGALDWRVSDVIVGTAPLTVQLSEIGRRPGYAGYRVTVTLKPDAPAGALKHELFLKTNDPASQLVPLLVEGTVQAPLTVSPSTVTLGSLKVGSATSQRVMIRGSQPFRILDVEGTGDGVRVEVPTAAGTVHFVTLHYQPQKAGDLHRQLQIKTDLTGEQPVPVTLEAHVDP
jgi:Protein of unknown function (DUF1573)